MFDSIVSLSDTKILFLASSFKLRTVLECHVTSRLKEKTGDADNGDQNNRTT